MTLERINPLDLPTPKAYTDVIAATGNKFVLVAGGIAEDGQGHLERSVMLVPTNLATKSFHGRR